MTELNELMGKIRPVPSFMEGYARVLYELGQLPDCLRALTLIRVLKRASGERYSEKWWDLELLTWQIWLDLGKNHNVRQALDNINAKYREYEGLGVLERSGRKDEFTKIKNQAR